jgi:hemolysin III
LQLEQRRVIESDGRPSGLIWNYDRTEKIADGVVHVIGVGLGIAGAIALAAMALKWAQGLEVAAVTVYAVGLLAVLGFSAAYNMWPVSRWKWLLRRFDHSAIYLLIAGTYTPFILQLKNGFVAGSLLIGIWLTAIVGIALKLLLPGRFDRLAIGLYLLLGWSGVMAYESVVAALPASTLWLLAAGGALYSVGVVFHVWRNLRFHNAIWHGFVLLAAVCHYFAVLGAVAFAGN